MILAFDRDAVALLTNRSDQVEARKSPQFCCLRIPVGRRVASESSHRARPIAAIAAGIENRVCTVHDTAALLD